jgi:hypothetical protein
METVMHEELSALEERLAATESLLAVVAATVIGDNMERRMSLIYALQKLEAGMRQSNRHAEAIETVRSFRMLMSEDDEL